MAMAKSLIATGRKQRDSGNLTAAVQSYREAAEIYRNLPDPLKFAHTIRHVGDILRELGSIEEARSCYEDALGIYREHTEASVLDHANAIRGFAVLREDAGELEEARSLWQDANSRYEGLKLEAGVRESEAHLRRLSQV
jgi:tetratricopeptide (TPR) repeat protein